jgi:xylulokinase
MNATLGIDIGTYESKGVLVDSSGRVLASAARPHELIVPRAGWAEHRAEQDWWGDFVWLARKLLADSGLEASEVKAVGASAIGPCMLPVDADGAPLMNAVLYGVDTRAAREIDDLTASIGADRILSHSGNALTSQAVGPKILWLKRNRPDIYAKARMFLNATSFLVHRLTGRFVTDHYSASNIAPLYDIEQRTWSDSLTQEITDLERLPEIAWTTEIAGAVTRRAAEETGLAFGTPVIVGTIDAAAEAISVGILDASEMMLMYGSTIFTIRIGSERIGDPRLWHAPWLFADQYACMAGLATSGTLTHWFADQLARDLSPEATMGALAAEARRQAPTGSFFSPIFPASGRRYTIRTPKAPSLV